MAKSVLKKDTDLHFPHFIVLKASAGSGKTRTLTERFVQFILSERVPRNRLRNMLAVTFSNNAAKEMKERTLSWLKSVCFGDEQDTAELSGIISLPPEELKMRACILIDEILDSYSDFQVKTIDSFMTGVFKASAIDFGYNPDFDILMNSDALMEYSFNLFLKEVREGSERAALLGQITDTLLEHKKTDSAYLWDPSSALLEEIKKIYRKLSATGKRPVIEDTAAEQRQIRQRIAYAVEEIEKEIESSGLKRHGNSSFESVLSLVRSKGFPDLIGRGFKNPPVTMPQKKGVEAYERIIRLWRETENLVNRYAVLFAYSLCAPYIMAYEAFGRTVEAAKRIQGKVFIDDVNLRLSEYLDGSIAPDVYFRLGETIFHFFIDEFQDTSPIQWRNLFPLIENSLSQGGSLFAVGDTKQAIYGFRNADYTIMKRLESDNPFPPAFHEVTELDRNYRSRKKILEFSEKVFRVNVAQASDYRDAGARSGLTTYLQKPVEGRNEEGFAGISLLERNDEDPEEKRKIQEIIQELRTRGYRYGEIAVLTQKNEDAVRVTTWLNEKEIPFISYSSLDVRRRKATGELVALLNFLDSPTDDFSFCAFILGDIFAKTLSREFADIGPERLREFCFLHRDTPPLYKAFQGQFRELWERYFEGLFRAAGFLPLYDLVTEVFAVFRVFESMPEEEAALVKVLEAVKDFEGMGFNSLKDFLGSASGDEEDETEWDMAVPRNIDAVQVMTVHKSKGLGFPVVIVLLYEVRKRGFDYIVREDGDAAILLKISKSMAGCDEGLGELYAQEEMKELVNRLNSLYVGFTRPERELYVVGVKDRDKAYPFDLLPGEEFPFSLKENLASICRPEPEAAFSPCLLLHRSGPLRLPASAEQLLSLEEKIRGEFVHLVLSRIEYAKEGFRDSLEGIIWQAKKETGADYPSDEVEELVMRLIADSETAVYFMEAPGRQIRREQEYADSSGRLFRMDRVVIDRDEVAVIDFKTGKHRDAINKYREQMETYMNILRDIYPGKKVKGLICLVDLGETERTG